MRVSVSMEFGSVEEAIKFLGEKVMGGVEAAPKKQHVDLKMKRGPGRPPNNKGGADPVKSPPIEAFQATQAPAPAAPTPEAAAPDAPVTSAAPAPAPEAPVAAASVPSDAEVVAALQKVLDTTNMEKVQQILAKYGAKRGRDVPLDKRAALVADCQAAVQ